MSLFDPTGRLIVEIRDDPTVAAITTRVRGGEPMGKTATDAGDARGPGEYIPFVVLVEIGHARLKRAPVQEVRYVARCYHATYQLAKALAGAVSDAAHARGHRITPAGGVIFGSFDDGGDGATKDPDTGQPHADVFVQVNALTELLPIA